jgi:transcriptional regulator with XRE-family HTH domain
VTVSRAPSEIFAERLKQARERLRGLSQSELAERAGLQAAAVSHFETGQRKPSFDNLRRLADALEVTTDYLLGRSDEPKTSAAPADPLYRDYDKLSSGDREVARVFMHSLAKRSKDRSRE